MKKQNVNQKGEVLFESEFYSEGDDVKRSSEIKKG